MQQLPKDIEEKLEKLEIIPFDGSEAFQRVILSDDFSDIFNYYRENYLPDILKSKPEVQQRISLYLNLTNQDQDFLNQTNEVLYRRPVPTIEEFLSNNYYMGYLNSTLYPYWREQLGKLFTAGSPIRKAIFSGCIGCLTEDTVVATLNGNKTIGELLNNFDNEWVLSYNTANNAWEPDKIVDVFYSGYKDVYEIELDNGEKIQCTSNHRFLTRKNKWVSIDNGLVPGLSMMPITNDSKAATVKSIKYVGKKDVYDITTERNHNFALKAGIVAHNCGKSTVARKVFVYVLYRMLCVRYPRAVLGVDADSTLASVIISMTLKQVYDTNLLPIVKLMEGMPCFQKVMSTRAFENFDLSNPKCPFPFTVEKSSGTVFFPDNIIVTCGSNQGHFTGYNVFNSFCLAGDTEIHTTCGDMQVAELTDKFSEGEKIFTYDLDGSEVEIVNAKQTALVQDTIKIWFDDENFIECTPNHKFLVKNPKEKDFYIVYIHGLPFKEAQYLTEEDEIEELNTLYPVTN